MMRILRLRCIGPRVVRTTRALLMPPTGHSGVTRLPRPCGTGANQLPGGTWHLMNRAAPTLVRSPAAGWLQFIHKRRRLPAAASTGLSRISHDTFAEVHDGSTLVARHQGSITWAARTPMARESWC